MPEVWSAVIDGVLSHKTGLDVLDIGTGPGFFPIIMSKLGHRVTGVDSSVTMLDEAKENLKSRIQQILQTTIFLLVKMS